MKVAIAGAGNVGTAIASDLHASGHDVLIFERDPDLVERLRPTLDVTWVAADACEVSSLDAAGLATVDVVVAATGDDEDNLVICLLAKRQFGVAHVVARVNDMENAWLFDRRWGVDAMVPAAMPLISLIEEAAGSTDTVALVRLTRAGVNVIETALNEKSRATGGTLGDVALPPGAIVAAVIRGGQPQPPDACLRLQADDELLVVSPTATAADIHAAFQ